MAKRFMAARKGTKAAVGRYVNVVPLSRTVPYPSSYAPCATGDVLVHGF